MRKTTKKQKILNWLLSGKPITPLEALEHFNSFRLAAVIHTLKAEGHKIITEDVTKKDSYGDSVTFAR